MKYKRSLLGLCVLPIMAGCATVAEPIQPTLNMAPTVSVAECTKEALLRQTVKPNGSALAEKYLSAVCLDALDNRDEILSVKAMLAILNIEQGDIKDAKKWRDSMGGASVVIDGENITHTIDYLLSGKTESLPSNTAFSKFIQSINY